MEAFKLEVQTLITSQYKRADNKSSLNGYPVSESKPFNVRKSAIKNKKLTNLRKLNNNITFERSIYILNVRDYKHQWLQ